MENLFSRTAPAFNVLVSSCLSMGMLLLSSHAYSSELPDEYGSHAAYCLAFLNARDDVLRAMLPDDLVVKEYNNSIALEKNFKSYYMIALSRGANPNDLVFALQHGKDDQKTLHSIIASAACERDPSGYKACYDALITSDDVAVLMVRQKSCDQPGWLPFW